MTEEGSPSVADLTRVRLAIQHDKEGLALARDGALAAALNEFEAAIKACPTFAEAWFHRGLALHQQGRARNAYESFAQAAFLAPDYLDAIEQIKILGPIIGAPREILTPWAEGGVGRLERLRQKLLPGANSSDPYAEQVPPSEESLRSALTRAARSAKHADDLGFLLQVQGRMVEAELFFRYALKLAPWYGRAAVHLCVLLEMVQRWSEADGIAAAAIAAGADDPRLPALALWSSIFVADWSNYPTWRAAALRAMRTDSRAATGHGMLITDDPELLFREACGHSAAYEKSIPALQLDFRRSTKGPITIAYISADFHDHPVALLSAELFELHDRNRFRIFGYGLVEVPHSAMGARIKRSFDQYVGLGDYSAQAAAERIAQDGVDILVDLTGNMMYGPKGIVARKPAPIQVNYLGTPGTSGSRRMDYAIVDKMIAPPGNEKWFTESLVYMPDCHQVNDRKRLVGVPRRREDYGLPSEGVVYCSFNETKKFTPEIFDVWLRILHRVPQSVLWLASQREASVANIRAYASRNGIDPSRIVFARRVPEHKDHLARYSVCDLYLDTLIYNGHATASDALWGGCPLVTTPGASYQTRVAASLLVAVGLPEFIASDITAYEQLAVEFGMNPELRRAARSKLAANRSSCALFDSPRFTRHLEWAFEHMWQERARGRPPSSFEVPALSE